MLSTAKLILPTFAFALTTSCLLTGIASSFADTVKPGAAPAAATVTTAETAAAPSNHKAATVPTTAQHKALIAVRAASPKHSPIATTSARGNSNALTTQARGNENVPGFAEALQEISPSIDITKQADIDRKAGNWQKAEGEYRTALQIWHWPEPYYGLGQCAEHDGDLATAISCYRHNIYSIYSDTPNRYGLVPGDGFQENSVERLMQYALLLNKAGQVQEAVFIYNRAAGLFNYYPDGNPNAPVPIPTIGQETGQASYTPQRMKALADIALSVNEFDYNLELKELEEATQLSPDLGVTWFYLGRYHFGRNLPGSPEIFHQAMQKVIQLDNGLAAHKAREWLQIEK